jgi:DNA excision repair protein ERCC-3
MIAENANQLNSASTYYNKNSKNNENIATRKDYSELKMHNTFINRSLYVGKDGHIFLETFGPLYKETSDFLIAIAEPVHRTKNIHEYALTQYSLYAAASMNVKTEDIIQILANLSKNELPSELIRYIKENTETYGKVKLILKNKRYFIECRDSGILRNLQQIPILYKAYQSIFNKRKNMSMFSNTSGKNLNFAGSDMIININLQNNTTTMSTTAPTDPLTSRMGELQSLIKNIMEDEKKEEQVEDIPSIGETFFEIDPEYLEEVKKVCIECKYPLLEEYDFKNDKTLPNMDILPRLKNPARAYQEKALSIMFSNERARSGIIVLPCGAGKTLIGIMAAATVKKNAIILCNSGVSVEQWYRECNNWAIIKPKDNIARFTSKRKDKFWNMEKSGGILITTYTMLSFAGKRSEEVGQLMDMIKNTEWGIMILDEVQVVPADMFRKILSIVKSHCKLGLTATLVREDKKIEDLNFLIGPKHYEANWLDLQRDGYLARVRCIEIWCEFTVEFYEEYLKSDSRRKMLLYVANPNKYFICKSLIEHHKNDKIIIFSDNLFSLERYALELGVPFISGRVGEEERVQILTLFRETNQCNCILMSKVGDTSLDLPNANVIIQISSHFGSRRQEAQRLGRILRPKKDNVSEYNAYFYSIVTKNTEEMYFSNKRHKFLVDQGYFFKVITSLNDIDVKHIIAENKISKEEVDNYMQKTLSEIKGVTNIEDESITDEDFVDVEMEDIKIRQNRDDESMSEYDGYYEDEYYEDDNNMQID